MDPMRALASLEFVSARGLDTADQGPSILANQVMMIIAMMMMIMWLIMMIDYDQFGKRMMKLVKKRNEFVLDIERQRRKRREVIDIIIIIFNLIIIIIIIIIMTIKL